jgi:hypothetical protein
MAHCNSISAASQDENRTPNAPPVLFNRSPTNLELISSFIFALLTLMVKYFRKSVIVT